MTDKRRWTIKDVAALRHMWGSGKSVKSIAAAFECHTSDVFQIACKHNFPSRESEQKIEDLDVCRWLVKNYCKLSNAIIATYLGVSPKTVGNYARTLGLTKQKNQHG